MKIQTMIAALFVTSCLASGSAWAQPFKPNEAGVTMGHWHLNSANIEANKKIFVEMGGTAAEGGPLQRVTFPGVVVILNQQPGTPPPVGGTVGTVVNHVGFIVKDGQGAVATWKAEAEPATLDNHNRLVPADLL